MQTIQEKWHPDRLTGESINEGGGVRQLQKKKKEKRLKGP
jgi:hypothetical protein